MQEQAKSLDAQIKSGNILQTGTINLKDGKIGGGAPGDKIHGFDGRITSRPGERADNHRGTDIAMSIGSRVDSPVSGKVIKSGAATSSSNGQKMHWSYGNMVVVQDDEGM
ncbi:M23 family metallopeptidase, partial [Staphylococcus haemolyticus]|uniref:M23 family metallopeptidase n=1 Tax=Staphylococcus haemolyticus TaxID=1283 RepID=UPI0030D1AABF